MKSFMHGLPYLGWNVLFRCIALATALVVTCQHLAHAQGQQPAAPVAAPPPAATPAPAPQQFQPSGEWAKLPRMQLERQYAGPLQDTIIQRWRDPADGTICYIYLPIAASHSPPTSSGYVQYGPNTIGSLSCSLPLIESTVAQTKRTRAPTMPAPILPVAPGQPQQAK
jgi:hypothetical protein